MAEQQGQDDLRVGRAGASDMAVSQVLKTTPTPHPCTALDSEERAL